MIIPFFKNYFTRHDFDNVAKVIKRGMYWANGPEIPKFEEKIAAVANRRFCCLFNSGTSALFGILSALDVRDREVIVPSFTFISSANTILHAGGIPVFADIEPNTLGLDSVDVEKRITKKTKAIIAVHYAGRPCDIMKLKKIALKYGLSLIEDAAEAIGARLNDQPVGSFGLAAMFSFTPSKVISTGEGGGVVTNSREIHEYLKLFRSHGRLESENYFTTVKSLDYISNGYNFRMPSIVAAQGLAQIDMLDFLIRKRRENAMRFSENFSGIRGLSVPLDDQQFYSTYQLYTVIVQRGRKIRDKLQTSLKAKGIVSKVYFESVHKTHFYEKVLKYNPRLPVTEGIAGSVLSLPVYPSLTIKEQDYIIKAVQHFFKKSNRAI